MWGDDRAERLAVRVGRRLALNHFQRLDQGDAGGEKGR